MSFLIEIQITITILNEFLTKFFYFIFELNSNALNFVLLISFVYSAQIYPNRNRPLNFADSQGQDDATKKVKIKWLIEKVSKVSHQSNFCIKMAETLYTCKILF